YRAIGEVVLAGELLPSRAIVLFEIGQHASHKQKIRRKTSMRVAVHLKRKTLVPIDPVSLRGRTVAAEPVEIVADLVFVEHVDEFLCISRQLATAISPDVPSRQPVIPRV